MSHAPDELLTRLLRDVSRSFYLTMRVLPGPVRPQIGLAYLLARATDTIADTKIVPVAQRLQALRELRERILGQTRAPLNFSALARSQGKQMLGHCDDFVREIELSKITDPAHPENVSAAERGLLERIEDVLGLCAGFAPDDQRRIRDVLDTITGGQALDLQRFGATRAGQIVALQTELELDDYTRRVAGCVGEFWTKMCRAHLFPGAPLDDAFLLANGVRFGQGLQYVNILRDLPKDLRQGRCYLPTEKLAAAGLTPADLLQPANEPRLRPLYDHYLDLTTEHLAAGWAYTNALPRAQVRVRLACAWPILIGVQTLAQLRHSNPLDATQRIKVSRADVRQIMLQSLLRYPFRTAWNGLWQLARRS